MDEKPRRSPLSDSQTEQLQTLLHDPELEELVSLLNFLSIDQLVMWAGRHKSCPTVPPRIHERLKLLNENNCDTTVVSGHEVWFKWRPLLADIFCFFEYLYEDGAGIKSVWSKTDDSVYSLSKSKRIISEDRNFYSRNIAIRDSNRIARIELLRALSSGAISIENAKRFNLEMTSSQNKFTSISMLNQAVRKGSDAEPQICSDFRPMESGDLVIRFFGMKEDDASRTSYNVLPATISSDRMTLEQIEKDGKLRISLKKGMRVHRGFWKQFLDIQKGCLEKNGLDLEDFIMQEFNKLAILASADHQRRLVFTGHSMGSALASITGFSFIKKDLFRITNNRTTAAYRLFQRFPENETLRDHLYIISFGAPKFALRKFSDWIEENIRHFINLQIIGDPIPGSPPLPKWLSPGKERVKLTSEWLEKVLKEKHGEDYSWEPFHFRYWKLIRQAVSKIQTLSEEQKEVRRQLWEDLERMDSNRFFDRMGQYGPLLNTTRDRFGQYPLHHICCLGDHQLVALFLFHSADPNLLDFELWSPLHRAYRGNHYKCVEVLLHFGANPHLITQTKYSCLHLAVRIRAEDADLQINAIKKLLEYDVDINSKTIKGVTPLMLALREAGRPELVRFLLDNGALAHVSCFLFTPLTLAISRRYEKEIVELLIQYNADPSFCTAEGDSFQLAIAEGREDLLPILRFALVHQNGIGKEFPSSLPNTPRK